MICGADISDILQQSTDDQVQMKNQRQGCVWKEIEGHIKTKVITPKYKNYCP